MENKSTETDGHEYTVRNDAYLTTWNVWNVFGRLRRCWPSLQLQLFHGAHCRLDQQVKVQLVQAGLGR